MDTPTLTKPLVNRLTVAERRLRAARAAVDDRTKERYELVMEARQVLSHREIAEILGMTIDAVFKLIERGTRQYG